jgi:branched-subunit amino acid ABC-type transport system permease component
MSIYRYIYFTILSVYKRFSRDPQINIFAVGFFSVLIFFTVLSIWGIYQYYVLNQYELSPKFMIISGASVFLFNTFYFLFGDDRQEEYYNKFSRQKNKFGSVAVAIYIVIAFALMIWTATKLREKNLENKQQTIEILKKPGKSRLFTFIAQQYF